MTATRTVLVAGVAVMIAAGCGAPSSGVTPPAPTSAASAPTSGPPSMSPPASPSPRLTVDARIAGGEVTPTNADLQATLGEPIEIRVDSDVADQLHIHSVPEHTFAVEARPGQSFAFRVDVPGRVAVELHELDRTIATIQVR